MESQWNPELKSIAEAFVANCRAGKEAEGLDTLYAADAVSAEALPTPGSESGETHGLEGIKGKHAWWNSAMEMHESEVTGPFLFGEDRFAVVFRIDVTERESGNRTQMQEVGVYTVAGGKIVREEFYYHPG